MRVILRAVAIGLFTLGFFAHPAAAQRSVEVYKVKYRVADELLPIVQAVMAPDGSATLDRATNSLVLVGDPATVSDALALLAMQDRKLRTVVLRFDTRRVRDLEEQGFGVRWTAEAGDFRVGNVRRPPGSGSSVDVRAGASMQQLTDSFSGTLRVTEGSSARIETGTSIPYSTVGPGGTNTEFVDAATGFEASPRILADGRVQVDLASFAGRPLRGGRIESTSSSTFVIATPGETLAVGGIDRASEAQRRETLSGTRSESGRDDTVLLLSVDVE
jgi:type II secretory pathway component GspD/PulD (secretin)